MRHAPLVRRSTALLAATTLLSAAGLASGAFIGVASAATATSVSPRFASNGPATATTITISGSGLTPLDQVSLKPTVVPAGQEKEVTPIAATVASASTDGSSLTVSATLTLAAPEKYDVVVTQGPTSTTCFGCLEVTNPSRPAVSSVAGSGAGSFTIAGTGFAKGAAVQWLKQGSSGLYDTPDDAFVFSPGSDSTGPSGTTHTTGYPSATQIRGSYTIAADKVPAVGKHLLRITNLDNQSSTGSVDFWQPSFAAVSPNRLGQGAKAAPVTLTGDGIRTGSYFAVAQSSSSTSDITVGTATPVNSVGTAVTAPVTVGTNGTPSARAVTLVGPDGGFVAVPGALTITAGPTITDTGSNPVGGTPAITPKALGRGGSVTNATVSGTGFQPGAVFSFGDPGLTAVTQSVPSATTATIVVTATQDAVLGGHNLTVTNPDYGSASTTDDGTPTKPYPFTVDPEPVASAFSPPALFPGASQNVTVTGTDFDTKGMTIQFGSQAPMAVTPTSSTQLTVKVTIPADATPGKRDVVLTNKADNGSSTCHGCFGVDSLRINGAHGASNTQSGWQITFQGTGSEPVASAVLSRHVRLADQPDLHGAVTQTTDGTSFVGTFDFASNGPAAPGDYNAVVVTHPTPTTSRSYFCTSCFTVVAADRPSTFTAISPAAAGQGATDLPVTVTGTDFSRGMAVSIDGATVSDTTWISATTVTATVTVPVGTATGVKDVTVTEADGTQPSTKTGAFTVNAGPTVTKVTTPAKDGKSLGQGATNQTVAVQGTGFTANSTVSLTGSPITVATAFVDATHLTATVSVPAGATLGDRDLTVTNRKNGAGDGGAGSLANAVTITPAPKATLISPTSVLAGETVPVTISGQGFQSASQPVITGVTFANIVVSADGTSLKADATAAKTAAAAVSHPKVVNSDGGTAVCTCTFAVQVPTVMVLTSPKVITAGTTTRIVATLKNANTGAALGGLQASLAFAPYQQSTSTATGTTTSAGQVSRGLRPYVNTKMVASFAGDISHLASSVSRVLPVATNVQVTSPVSGATTAASTLLVVRGTTSPNKAGRSVALYRYYSGAYHIVASAKVASNGTYAIGIRLPRGAYTMLTGIYYTPGNNVGYSRAFSVRRS